ncbi:hypothetical protein [Chitinimonas sp. BJYL2]|uniref:hypothetical protein n=1 Tax=Chitinimonas sp. BJYL2 TaxID=2976696 RepID=UPI0022B51031|nr:hypothetical protein [Chitinimonas sp. BJYL2]
MKQSLMTLMIAMAASHATAATWSDTFIGYRYGTNHAEPAIPHDITKHIVQFNHVSGYSLGSNLLNVDLLISDDKDPAAGGKEGAQEIYLLYRHQMSMGKLSGQDMSWGPVKDLAITGGFDANTKNTAFAPKKRMLVIGPTLKFDVPQGFWDMSVFYRDERNHNGLSFAKQNKIHFKRTWQFDTAWGIPFDAGGVPMRFKGFLNYIPAKGRDGFLAETKPETYLNAALMADIGSLIAERKDAVYAGLGYRYWHNKFGNAPGVGTRERGVSLQLEWHL